MQLHTFFFFFSRLLASHLQEGKDLLTFHLPRKLRQSFEIEISTSQTLYAHLILLELNN